ncbi:LPXTG cell wall anchor domain-containing protein, partial [Hathewaya limosa]|uniref:LPXTG cell wall anchor domain-containing protein n=1 Tax=Hathewaya limosa TaxID=1536 RepID=UPI0031DCA73A
KDQKQNINKDTESEVKNIKNIDNEELKQKKTKNKKEELNKKRLEPMNEKNKEIQYKQEVTSRKFKDNKNKEKLIQKDKLPQTGLPINTGILASMGTILSGLGIVLRKRFKK